MGMAPGCARVSKQGIGTTGRPSAVPNGRQGGGAAAGCIELQGGFQFPPIPEIRGLVSAEWVLVKWVH
jgi:hypothetical protein